MVEANADEPLRENLPIRSAVSRGLTKLRGASVTLLGEDTVLAVVAFFGLSGFFGSPVGHAIYCFFFVGLWGVKVQSRWFFSLSQVWSSLIWHSRFS